MEPNKRRDDERRDGEEQAVAGYGRVEIVRDSDSPPVHAAPPPRFDGGATFTHVVIGTPK